jgi:hypothetical protein
MANANRFAAVHGRVWAIGVFLVRLAFSGVAGLIAWVAATLIFQGYIMNPPLCPIGEAPPGCTYQEPNWSVWGAPLAGLLVAGAVLALTRRWQRYSPNRDTTQSRVTQADRFILAGAGLYFVWSLFPVWFKFAPVARFTYSPFAFPSPVNAWNTVTTVAAVSSILAFLWTAERIAGMDIRIRAGLIDGSLAGVGMLCTVLGLIIQPWHYDADWGLFVGIALALVWSYGAVLRFLVPE